MPDVTQPTPTLAPDQTGGLFQKRKQLEQDIEHITQEMYRRNKELADTNKTLSLLRQIDTLVLEPQTTLTMVCEQISEAITQTTSYAFVGILTQSAIGGKELSLKGWSGYNWLDKAEHILGFTQPPRLELVHPWLMKWFGQAQKSLIINLENIAAQAVAGFLGTPETDLKQVQQQLGLKSLYVVKLLARRQLVGLLVVGFSYPPEQINPADTGLIDRLSDSIGVALDNKLLFEENQRVVRQLQETNAKLRALDETKDDFISMASHQLRTPLTSVKGYLSMVLEEDAGKITPEQRNMLSQAFFSSQRMVYLIADLLNVSRLKTGKFVIDRSKVNLANMVEEELGQLKETAAARSLAVQYDKPADFPELLLDETKTRQVIMNFVDNAIYYTPAHGHITVKLINNPETVELRVVDDGIGVPQAEQPHLFTKFYRAGNARKARPDGTGLGLFMAKKVIVAQGGSIIFESTEGKGSTFGFIFSKKQPAPTEVKAG